MSIPKIMALPLSWHDAKPLLANMDGPVAPDDWQGGLPIKYHLGGERVRVHVKIEMDNSTQALLRGRRPHSRRASCPMNGSCLAIIAMPGFSAASTPAAAPHR